MPALVKAAILGVVQGLTEFLPVSSTAHLLVGGRLLGYDDPGGVFTVMIQLGSILAIVWLYRRMLIDVVRGLPSNPASQRFAVLVLTAFVPALLAGAFLSDFVKSVLYHSFTAMAVAFIVGGVVMLVVERFGPPATIATMDDMRPPRAATIGAFQTLALVPGVSRSGATMVGGLVVGLDRRLAAEFSFFLAIPTMTAAFTHDLIEVRHSLSADRATEIAVGFVMAFVAARLVVKPFLAFVKRSGFAVFAWYRIAIGLLLLGLVARGWS